MMTVGSKKGGKKAGGRKAAKKPGTRKPYVRKSEQNETEKLEWNEQLERAALLVSQDVLSDEKIAEELGIGRTTLHRWKNDALFVGRVKQIIEEIKAAIVARGIAERQNRVDAYNDRWRKMQEVINQRAKAYAHVTVGGNTGLIVKQTKGIGKGKDFQIVDEYAVDTGLLRELREHEKQAAIELDQWAERHEHTGKGGEDLFKHITVEIVDPHEGSDE